MPRTQIVTAFFSFRLEDSNDKILECHRKQNVALKVQRWRELVYRGESGGEIEFWETWGHLALI